MKKISDTTSLLFIGMPVADIIVPADLNEHVIEQYGIHAGGRTMLAAAQVAGIEQLLRQEKYVVVAGGSMANSACIVAQLCSSLQARFFARTAQDNYGEIFRQAIIAAGLEIVPDGYAGKESSRSYMITDSHGERGFGRYMGDSMNGLVSSSETLEEAIMQSDVVFIEGELPALADGTNLWHYILSTAKKHQTRIGITLFGAEQVKKHRELLWDTINNHADYIFGNETELAALYEKNEKYQHDVACRDVADKLFTRNTDAVLCISNGREAPTLITSEGSFHTTAQAVSSIVNTSGAGDAFMGGVLSGLLQGFSGDESLMLGHRIAALVIQQEAPQLPAPILEQFVQVRKQKQVSG